MPLPEGREMGATFRLMLVTQLPSMGRGGRARQELPVQYSPQLMVMSIVVIPISNQRSGTGATSKLPLDHFQLRGALN